MIFLNSLLSKTLLRKMKNAESASRDILLDKVYCSISPAPKDTYQILVRCKCLDPYLTGFGDDNLVRIYGKKGIVNLSAAFGHLSEQVSIASKIFTKTFFFLRHEAVCYELKFPDTDWISSPERMFVCSVCQQKKLFSADWFWEDKGGLPACCNRSMQRLI